MPKLADVSKIWSYNEDSPTGIKSIPNSFCLAKLFKRMLVVSFNNSVSVILPAQKLSNSLFHSRFSTILGYLKFVFFIFVMFIFFPSLFLFFLVVYFNNSITVILPSQKLSNALFHSRFSPILG